ncbi:MAG TPA: GNAT family N-acetyltransferase [Bryobacteraceae bacterium]|nr:GNAT family N-acetyltransferase [Bryobacteraceae bacterium]
MASNLRITPATEADIPVILRLIRGLARYERLSHEVVATEDDLRAALFGPHPAAEVIVARLDDQPVGFALFFHNFSTFLGRAGIYLEDLFVEPAHRGKGVGKALLHHLAKLAIQRRCGRLEWAVLNWNQPAIDFYHHAGAVAMNDWTVFRLTGDALVRFAG